MKNDNTGELRSIASAVHEAIVRTFVARLLMDSAHVPIERAIAFLVDGLVLDSSEHEHLLKCQQCRYEMVHAAFKELKKRRQSDKGRE